jgi:hypothetical protein
MRELFGSSAAYYGKEKLPEIVPVPANLVFVFLGNDSKDDIFTA